MKLSKKMLFLVIFLCGAVFELIRGNYIIIPGISKVSSPSVSSTSGKAAEVKTEFTAGTAVAVINTEVPDKKTGENNPAVPAEYKNALKQAQSLSQNGDMSKDRIYAFLIGEHAGGFPEDAAQYAVDNLTSDYNENALKTAERLAREASMSKKALYDFLIGEQAGGFTPEEAQYAVDNLVWDYKENALKSAERLLKESSMSRSRIRDFLVGEHAGRFTEEEADYAMSKLAE